MRIFVNSEETDRGCEQFVGEEKMSGTNAASCAESGVAGIPPAYASCRQSLPSLTYAGGLIHCKHYGETITGESVVKKSSRQEYVHDRCSLYNTPGHPRV